HSRSTMCRAREDWENFCPAVSCACSSQAGPPERLLALEWRTRIGLARRDGQTQGEGRPLTFPRALGRDRAAVQLDEMARDRQAEAQARRRASPSDPRLTEPLEQVRHELRADP